jgi:hypothetical protein
MRSYGSGSGVPFSRVTSPEIMRRTSSNFLKHLVVQGFLDKAEIAAEQQNVFEFVRGGSGSLQIVREFKVRGSTSPLGNRPRNGNGTAPKMRSQTHRFARRQILRCLINAENKGVGLAPDVQLVEVLHQSSKKTFCEL